jgi:hypothetical protein
MQINNCSKYGNSKSYMGCHEPCKVLSTEHVRQGEKLCLDFYCLQNNYNPVNPNYKPVKEEV